MKFKLLLFFAIFFVLSSCSSDFDDNLDLSQDSQIVDTETLISEDSNVFSMMESIAGTGDLEFAEEVCIRFLYPFTIKEYDMDGVELGSNVVSSDGQFYGILLGIPDEQYINLSFPIEATLPDGTTFSVTNKDELAEAMQNCIDELQEGVIGYCEGQVAECAWVVTVAEGSEDDNYVNSVFTAVNLGLNTYYYRGEAYESSWIFYFIENKLHLNISIEDTELGTVWNYDWETAITEIDEIPISNADGAAYILKEECEEDAYCTTLMFTECEDPSMPGIATFMLEDLISCIDIIAAPQQDNRNSYRLIDYIFTFHVSEADAEDNINAIDASAPYVTSTASETIFVRIEHPDTGEFIVTSITLIAESC